MFYNAILFSGHFPDGTYISAISILGQSHYRKELALKGTILTKLAHNRQTLYLKS